MKKVLLFVILAAVLAVVVKNDFGVKGTLNAKNITSIEVNYRPWDVSRPRYGL